MILNFLKQRGLLLALMLVTAWAVSIQIENHGLKGKLDRCQRGKASMIAAKNESRVLAEAAREDQERRSAANAEKSDASHAENLHRANLAAGDYAAAHRITAGGPRAQGHRGETSEALAVAESRATGVPAGVSDDPLVAISSPDLQTCTAVAHAVAAHNWPATISQP